MCVCVCGGGGCVCSLANYSVAYEEIQSNGVSYLIDFVCPLFPKAILFDFYFIILTVLRRWSRCYCLLFVVYSKRRFVFSLVLCYFVLVFSVLLALRLPRLGKRELILMLFVRLFDLLLFGFSSVSSSSWCLGRAAACDCDTPWTFLFPFFSNQFCNFICVLFVGINVLM